MERAKINKQVVARGYFDPDVKLATKCFILPATLFMTIALLLPLGLAYATTKTFCTIPHRLLFTNNITDISLSIVQDASPTIISQTYRYSYPAVFMLIIMLGIGYFFKTMMDKWKQSVRDEIYLIGERLHNHGERRSLTHGNLVGVQTDAADGEIRLVDDVLLPEIDATVNA